MTFAAHLRHAKSTESLIAVLTTRRVGQCWLLTGSISVEGMVGTKLRLLATTAAATTQMIATSRIGPPTK